MKKVVKLLTAKNGVITFNTIDEMIEAISRRTGISKNKIMIKDGRVLLPDGRSNPFYIERVLEGREWVVNALRGRVCIVKSIGEDGVLYTLQHRIPPEVWRKVSMYFEHFTRKEDYDGYADFFFIGSVNDWVTTNPEEVTKIIKEEAEKVATSLEREEARILEEEQIIREQKRKEMEEQKIEKEKRIQEENKRKHEEFIEKKKEISDEWVDVSFNHHTIAKIINPKHTGFRKTGYYDPVKNEELWVSNADPNIYCIAGENITLDIIYHLMPRKLVELAMKS